MTTLHYLAYGSNLHPLRLGARIRSAQVLGVVEMPGCRLAFHKRGADGSGKCLFYAGEAGQRAFGVIYRFDVADKATLDGFEGVGYGEQLLDFVLDAQPCRPYVYVAETTHIDPLLRPYDWYKALVLAGARFHGLPADYIAAIEAQPAVTDPDPARAAENAQLLARMGVSVG